uniref:Uncharacterized protein n=1 Tax=Opuntia streptacantha TaxID=393608 RepID=A0A7C9EDX0_OPUST
MEPRQDFQTLFFCIVYTKPTHFSFFTASYNYVTGQECFQRTRGFLKKTNKLKGKNRGSPKLSSTGGWGGKMGSDSVLYISCQEGNPKDDISFIFPLERPAFAFSSSFCKMASPSLNPMSSFIHIDKDNHTHHVDRTDHRFAVNL